MNYILATCLLIGSSILVRAAGDLEPTSAPAPTMHSLEEIYQTVSGSTDPNQILPLPNTSVAQGTNFIHMSVLATTQGQIKGSCTARGRENTIVVDSIDHGIISPRDAASGLPTGKRQHRPVKVTARIDKATPLLFNALINNENLNEVRLQFWATDSTGGLSQYFTIELVNASISGIQMGARDQIEISFVYQKIIWTWMDGGITAEDDWEAPVD